MHGICQEQVRQWFKSTSGKGWFLIKDFILGIEKIEGRFIKLLHHDFRYSELQQSTQLILRIWNAIWVFILSVQGSQICKAMLLTRLLTIPQLDLESGTGGRYTTEDPERLTCVQSDQISHSTVLLFVLHCQKAAVLRWDPFISWFLVKVKSSLWMNWTFDFCYFLFICGRKFVY